MLKEIEIVDFLSRTHISQRFIYVVIRKWGEYMLKEIEIVDLSRTQMRVGDSVRARCDDCAKMVLLG